MRPSARKSIPLILSALVSLLAGCAGAHRPDTDVARSVEAADRHRLQTIVLASADDDFPMALPVAGHIVSGSETVAPPPAAAVAGDGAPDRFFAPAPAEQRSFSLSFDSDRSLLDDTDPATEGRREDGSKKRPQLGLQLFRFSVLGRPLHLRCSIKNKHLMFGAKIEL